MLRVSRGTLIFLILFLSLGFLHLLFFSLVTEEQFVRSIGSYLNAICAFSVGKIYISRYGVEKFEKLLRFTFIFFISVAILQFLNLIPFLNSFFYLLKGRGGAGLSDSLRGVSIFATEPSRAAYEMILIYLMVRLSLVKFHRLKIYDFAFFVFIALVIKSMTGLLLCTIFFAFYYVSFRKLIQLSIFILLFLTSLFFILEELAQLNNRAINLVIQVLESPEPIKLFMQASGFRIISIVSSYVYAFNDIWGSGIGSWEQSSLLALDYVDARSLEVPYFYYSCGEYICSVRPTSLLANVALDFGLIGIIFMFYFLIKFKNSLNKKYYHGFYFIVFLFLCSSTVGHPLIWIVIAYLQALSKNECER
ncbi:hypothetical protein EDB65_10747 [Vibrio crassostreae]|nr:hypothetical protein EDB65_10747 [Vibrio crassostreae]